MSDIGKPSLTPMRGRRHRAALATGMATVALLAAACGSSGTKTGSPPATTAGTNGGSAKPDLAYFKGKTITMIAPDKPGGGFDNWARTTAPYMAQYLHATINIENIPAGNTIVGQNTLASSQPNGLTIGWLNLTEDVSDKAAGVTGVTFDPSQLGIIGSTPPIPVVVLATPKSGFKSFDALTSAPQVTALTQTKGSTALIERVILAAFGVKTKYIAGYESSADLKAGFSRGDGEVAVDNVSAFGPFITGNAGVPLLVTSSVPSSSSLAPALANVPTLPQYEKSHPPAGNLGQVLDAVMAVYTYNATLAAPSGVPAARLAALQAAMKWAMQQPGAQQQAAKLHLHAGYETPQATIQGIQTGYA
ncbi:MAG: hypothetical protein ACRDWW_03135, partial [Acidimicrobiales bacterium]